MLGPVTPYTWPPPSWTLGTVDVQALLGRARAHGIRVWRDGDSLDVRPDKATANLIRLIREHKDAVLVELDRERDRDQGPLPPPFRPAVAASDGLPVRADGSVKGAPPD